MCSEKKKHFGGYSISTLEYMPSVAPCVIWEVHSMKEGGDGTCRCNRTAGRVERAREGREGEGGEGRWSLMAQARGR